MGVMKAGTPIPTADVAGAKRPTRETILRAQDVSKSFRMGDQTVHVLRNVDMVVNEGEFIAIEGRSGSGKSTLLHILGALDAADHGRIEYAGGDFTAMSANDRSRLRNTQFGFVFQFYHLLPEFNVIENTMLSSMIENSWFAWRNKRNALRERAAMLLNEFGMGHRLKHRPSQLSGGERQRVAIARALMNEPKVLFADEPTGNLDAETGRQIMAVLEKLHAEMRQTLIMVTHDRALARQADRVLVLKEGRLSKAES